MASRGKRALTRAETLVSALRHLPEGKGTMDPGSLVHVAALVGTVLGREDLDRAIVSVVKSYGIDESGVSGWLSGMSDEDLMAAFSADLRPPSMSELSDLAGWRGRFIPDSVTRLAVGLLLALQRPGRSAICGAGDISAVVLAKSLVPDAEIVCRTPAERAAAALGLALSGFEWGVPKISDFRWHEKYKSCLSLAEMGTLDQIADSIAGQNADTVIVVPRSFLTYHRQDVERSILAGSGNLRVVVDASKDYGIMVLDDTVKRHDLPIYMAKTWGPGFERFTGDVVKAIVNGEPVEYVGLPVEVEIIGASGVASLNPATYMNVVPPVSVESLTLEPARIEAEIDEYLSLSNSIRDSGREFAEAYRRALRTICGQPSQTVSEVPAENLISVERRRSVR